MSPQSSDVVVRIKADTRQFNRAMRRAMRMLWWMKWGGWVIVITAAAILFLAGAVTGWLIR